MNTPNLNSICTDSRLWYYDFLFENKRENIPEKTLKHINSCQYCQKGIKDIESLLSDSKIATNDVKQEIDKTIYTLISLHLALVDIPVTCEIAKSFIPRLTDPLLQIKIPTPINVHLDNCQACTEDFNTIKNLSLNHEQLGYLGQILADTPDDKSDICPDAQVTIPSIASLNFQGITSDVLKHVCACPDCRKAILRYRQKKYEELTNNKNLSEESTCCNISMSDIFYLCLPYEFDYISDDSVKESKFLKSHILNCPVCLKKMQHLYTDINNIAERPNTDIITIFSLGRPDRSKQKNIEDIYSDWSYKVQVIDNTTSKVQKNNYQSEFVTKQKSNTITVKIRKYAKPFATAAVILMALALFFYSSSAKAVDLSQIYNALMNVKNVYITRSMPDGSTLYQEEWLSRTFNVRIAKTREQYVLWDIENNVRKIRSLSDNSIETIPLPPDIYNRVEQSITGVLNIMPFQNIKQVPKNATWHLVNADKAENKIVDSSVYELVWTDDNGQLNKCLFFVDNSTYLVKKIKYYYKQKNQEIFVLKSIEDLEYINDIEVEKVLEIIQTNSTE